MGKQPKQSKQSKLATIKGILNGTVSLKDLIPTAPSWFLNIRYEDSPFEKEDEERRQQKLLEEPNLTIIDIEVLHSNASTEPTPKPELKHTLLSTTKAADEALLQETKATNKRLQRRHSAGIKATESPSNKQPDNGGLLSLYGEPGGWKVIQNFKQKS